MAPRTWSARPADSVWRAPLVPPALALTAGIILDRHFSVPPLFSLVAAAAFLVAWLVANTGSQKELSLFYLWAGFAGIGAAYHHSYRESVPASDISHFASAQSRPVHLRGSLYSEPSFTRARDEPLRTFPASASTRFVLHVTHLQSGADWVAVSGLVQVTVPARLHKVHVGDELEIVGRLSLPLGPANPGDFDYAAYLRDQGIGAVLEVPATSEAMTLLGQGWPASLFGWLAMLRGWGQEVLTHNLPEQYQGLAIALLLGEGSGMTGDDWEKYLRTGVIHVLAISGQHLVVLAAFLWLVLRLGRFSRRRGALAIALLLVAYALLTGGRPPVMRSAWAVAVYCGGIVLRRPVLPANAFALAWIGVAACNPTDIFNNGCQLSFLAVAVLFWGVGHWARTADDPLQRLVEESRSLALRLFVSLCRWVAWCYVVNAVVWLAVAPLVAERYHLVSPVALLIGPPMVLLSSLALLSGFLLLLVSAFGLAPVFAWPTYALLAGCDLLVNVGGALPYAYFFVTGLPEWWLWIFYLGLFAFLTIEWLRQRPRVWLSAGLAWTGLGIALSAWPFRPGEFRCVFLAVGHGGATVIESPEGHVLVYDAGSMAGPDVTRRHVAPYLWQRGTGHIDDLLLSHADLDHFNGVMALLDRFSVRRVSLTPSFSERLTLATQMTLHAIQQRGIPTRILQAGDHFEVDDIRIDVLHPPLNGPEGKENARSLVLLVRHEDLSILLTGDLEEPGLSQVLASPPRAVDVLMAPHHGSRFSNTPALAKWARPKVVVSSQGPPKGNPKAVNPYEAIGTRYLMTWGQGAITIRKSDVGWQAEGFGTGEMWSFTGRNR